MKDFKYLKKQRILSKDTKSVNENVLVVNDGELFKVSKVIDVPQKLINALLKKAKDESGKDPKIFWNEVAVSDEIVKYILDTYLNIESLPASILMGDTALESPKPGEVEDDLGEIAPEGEEAPAAEGDIPADLELEAPAAEETPAEPTEEVPALETEVEEKEEETEEEA